MVAIQQQQLHPSSHCFCLGYEYFRSRQDILREKKKLQESLLYHKMLNYRINHHQVCHSESLIMLNK